MSALATLGGPARTRPLRMLMTLDAVGGVWRYGIDLAAELRKRGVETVLAVFGPPPSPAQRQEAEAVGTVAVIGAPLDWMVGEAEALDGIPSLIARLVDAHAIDLVHLNLPSQAAGLRLSIPVLVVSHSCVVTWFHAVRGTGVPPDWTWQQSYNAAGIAVADAVIAPSAAHAAMLRAAYGAGQPIHVVHNAAAATPAPTEKEAFAFAAGRWWDEGKNGSVLDIAAAHSAFPVRLAGALTGPNGQRLDVRHAEALGELEHAEVRRLMGRAAVFVSPSLYEPFGLSALEAAYTGAALLLADIPTYRELWDQAALFADPRDAGAFAAALDALAADPERAVRLGQAARERAGRYTFRAQADAMLGHYARVLHGTGQRRQVG